MEKAIKYYIPNTDKGIVGNLSKRLFTRSVPKFPRAIQIQTQTGCNGACIFCPYKDSYDKVPKGKMSDELFNKIVAEIAQYNMTKRISPYLMNEPFLDKTILDKSRYIKQLVPASKVVATTNAGKLTREIVDDIVRDNPFRAIYISMQGIEKVPYETSMQGSLEFEETLENVEYLVEQQKKHLPNLKIVVTMIKTSMINAEAAVKHWLAKGIESKYTLLENRGGNLSDFDKINLENKQQHIHCSRLFKQAFILFNGDMLLCCTDYYKTMVLGNVLESSIYDVWNSKKAVEIRKNFLDGNLKDNPLCASCYKSCT